MPAKKYTCPNPKCNNDRFHEVGSMQTTTGVKLLPPLKKGGKASLQRL